VAWLAKGRVSEADGLRFGSRDIVAWVGCIS